MTKVLRLVNGQVVELLDGQGGVYSATVTATGKEVVLNIDELIAREGSRGCRLFLMQGILKGEKMDMVIQKSTELGVTRFGGFESSRTQGRLDVQKKRKKLERWQRISLAACKQSGRTIPMQIDPVMSFTDLISSNTHPEEALKLLFWEEERNVRLRDLPGLPAAMNITVLLGPEGGVSSEEVGLAKEHGWTTVCLGRQILRAETASLAVVSIIQHLTGGL